MKRKGQFEIYNNNGEKIYNVFLNGTYSEFLESGVKVRVENANDWYFDNWEIKVPRWKSCEQRENKGLKRMFRELTDLKLYGLYAEIVELLDNFKR